MFIEQNEFNDNNLSNDNISLRDLFNKFKNWYYFIISKWKILILIGALGGIMGFIFAFFEKPSYKAVLTFAMEEDKSSGGIGGALGIASSFGFDLGGAGSGSVFSATNLSGLMKSRLIVEKVLLSPLTLKDTSVSLADYYIQINSLNKNWDKNPILKNINFQSNLDRNKFSFQHDSILQIIYKKVIHVDKLSIMQKDKKITIFSIEVNSNDELFSKIFCERIAKETSDFYIETKSKKARINTGVLQKQVDSIRFELNNSITKVASEVDDVYNLNPAFNIKSSASKKKQIDVQTNTAILTNLVAQLEISKINLRKETPLIQLIDSPILPLEKKSIGKLKGILLGAIFSIFFFIIFLFFKNYLKQSL
jgi:hypothetical protein